MVAEATIAITKDGYGHLVEGDKRSAAELMSRGVVRWLIASVAPGMAPSGHIEGPSQDSERAVDLGALGGTRTPNLLIRRVFRAPPPPAYMPVDLVGSCSLMRSRRQH
jgi:hypothetical protein